MSRKLAYSGVVTHRLNGRVLFQIEYFEADSRQLAIDHLFHCALDVTNNGVMTRDMKVSLTPTCAARFDKEV